MVNKNGFREVIFCGFYGYSPLNSVTIDISFNKKEVCLYAFICAKMYNIFLCVNSA